MKRGKTPKHSKTKHQTPNILMKQKQQSTRDFPKQLSTANLFCVVVDRIISCSVILDIQYLMNRKILTPC